MYKNCLSVKVAINFPNNSIFTPQSFQPAERTKDYNVATGCKVREANPPVRDGMPSETTDDGRGEEGVE